MKQKEEDGEETRGHRKGETHLETSFLLSKGFTVSPIEVFHGFVRARGVQHFEEAHPDLII